MRRQRMMTIILLLSGLSTLTSFTGGTGEEKGIVGIWQSAANDLRVEMYAHHGQYNGRLVWFLWEGDDPPMAAQLDTENPNPALRSRSWLGMNIVEQLTYIGHDEWSGGKVYDPNSGHTFEATVRLIDSDRLVVRGYWKLPVLGRNMQFRRVSGVISNRTNFLQKIK
jgi:uncharacterized protein (DUF2147 family)